MAQRCTRRLTTLGRQFLTRATSDAVCPKPSGCPAYWGPTGWAASQTATMAFQGKGFSCRAISTFPSLAASIKVPSMGESIEEGTISAILKQEGDSVEMDEAIFQIETDKVTVDVRAPGAGVINKILVKAEETVRVGQELADVGSGSGEEKPRSSGMSQEQSDTATAKAPVEDDKTKLEEKPIAGEPMGGEPSPSDTSSAPSSQPGSSARQQDSSSGQDTSKQDPSKQGTSVQNSQTADAKEATPSPGADTGKQRIRFPRRRTPDGERISALSAEEQEKYKEEGTATEQHSQSEQAPSQPQAASRQPQKPSASEPNRFVPYAGQDRGTKLSQARVLSAREMELIELGGAEP